MVQYKDKYFPGMVCIVPPPGGEDFCHFGAATKPKSQRSKSQLCSERIPYIMVQVFKSCGVFRNIDNLFCLYFALRLSQFAVIFNYPDDAVVHRISAQTPSSGDMSELR